MKNPHEVYVWNTRKECEFVERLGKISNPMASNAVIKQILIGYINSAWMKDWVGLGIDGPMCIELAKRRLKEL